MKISEKSPATFIREAVNAAKPAKRILMYQDRWLAGWLAGWLVQPTKTGRWVYVCKYMPYVLNHPQILHHIMFTGEVWG